MDGFVYKWINQINMRWYVGSHCGSPNDGYIASGKIIKQAIKKNGLNNFKRQILYQGQNYRQEEEKYLIEHDAANNPYSYNLKNTSIGGSVKGRTAWNKGKPGTFLGKTHNATTKQKMSSLKKQHFKTRRGTFYGKSHTEKTLKKLQGTHNILTEQQVKVIKQKLKKGGKWGYKSKLARKYNIHPNTLLDIDKNRTWSWV